MTIIRKKANTWLLSRVRVMTMIEQLHVPSGELTFPIFLPDATRAVVRSVDSRDIEEVGIEALVMNVFHLMQNPGSSTIKALGGLHKMAGWNHPIVTDSGGFQIYSLIHQNSSLGSVSNKGATFQTDKAAKKINLSPEKSVQLQMSFGADIMFTLDDCTHADDPHDMQLESVERTIAWAQRCKDEYEHLLNDKNFDESERPLLFAVVQGGDDDDLRRQCADALLEIGFDGYGYGGYPLDGKGNLLEDTIGFVRELIPDEFPLHALGVGHPSNIAACYDLGYQMFDSAFPTRDARRGRLYCWSSADALPTGAKDWFSYVYIEDNKFIKADVPICEHCDCWVCDRYSRGYINHLFSINDGAAWRLSTIHNLYFMAQVIERLRG